MEFASLSVLHGQSGQVRVAPEIFVLIVLMLERWWPMEIASIKRPGHFGGSLTHFYKQICCFSSVSCVCCYCLFVCFLSASGVFERPRPPRPPPPPPPPRPRPPPPTRCCTGTWPATMCVPNGTMKRPAMPSIEGQTRQTIVVGAFWKRTIARGCIGKCRRRSTKGFM